MFIKDSVVDNNIDLLSINETWLKNSPDSDYVVRDICPSGYDFLHVPRPNRHGGGVGVLFNNKLSLKHNNTGDSFLTFEHMELTINLNQKK